MLDGTKIDDANSPEIRFAGFTDAWGLCKLGDIRSFQKVADIKG